MGTPRSELPPNIRKVVEKQYPKGTPIPKPAKREKKKPKPLRHTSLGRLREASEERAFRRVVKARNGWWCDWCNSSGGVAVHHISGRYPSIRYEPLNGIHLCFGCHAQAHAERETFFEWLENARPEQYQFAMEQKKMIQSVVIELPLPHANLSPNYSPNSVRAKKWVRVLKKEARQLACVKTLKANKWFYEGWDKATSQATFYFATNRRRDTRNFEAMLKSYEDGIVEAGLLIDDNHLVLTPLPTKMLIDKENPRVEITITRGEPK